jgi:hypothetical protein
MFTSLSAIPKRQQLRLALFEGQAKGFDIPFHLRGKGFVILL